MLALTLALMLLLWSFNYIAGKIALRHMDPISLACFRIELAAIIMLPIYFSRKQRAALRLRDLWPFAYLRILGSGGQPGTFYRRTELHHVRSFRGDHRGWPDHHSVTGSHHEAGGRHSPQKYWEWR